MIKKIGICSIGYSGATHTENFEFPDDYTEEEMENELWEWANQFVEAWFEEDDENE